LLSWECQDFQIRPEYVIFIIHLFVHLAENLPSFIISHTHDAFDVAAPNSMQCYESSKWPAV